VAENRLITLLFSGTRRKVLRLLLTQPDKRYCVREISRRIGVVPGALHHELKRLHRAGLLLRQPFGNQVCYFIDQSNVIYDDLLSIFRKDDGRVEELGRILQPYGGSIQCAFIFSPQGAEPGGSIDLFVLGSLTVTEIVQIMTEVQSILRVGLNPVVMTGEELQQKIAESDPFLDELEAAVKSCVVGEIGYFTELLSVAKEKGVNTTDPCIKGLLAMAEWNLANAEVKANSLGNRFDTAYKTLLQSSLIVLLLEGQGHSSTNEQTRDLLSSIAGSGESMVNFDRQRKKRNNSDYYGAPVDKFTTETCVSAARERLQEVRAWLQEHYSDMLG
jgi:hypothetical protein